MASPAQTSRSTAYLLRRPARLHAAVLALALLIVGAIAGVAPGSFSLVNEIGAGVAWRSSESAPLERRFVLVDIDERSLQEVGPWPWPREKMAELVSALDRQQVGLKLFDVVFPEPKAGDSLLTSIMDEAKAGPNVAAQVFSLDPTNATRAGLLTGALPLAVCPPMAAKGYGYLGNGFPVAKAGHITPRIDPDGAVRHVPAMVCMDGKAYPTLVLAGLSEISGGGAIALSPADSIAAAPWTLTFPGLPGVRVPLGENGDLRVSYRLPRDSFVAVSAADVLANRAPVELLKQSWVIVGATAFGLGDTVPTPLGGAVSGLEIHAQLLSAILDDRLPYTPTVVSLLPWALGALMVLVLLSIARVSVDRFSRGRSVALPLAGLGLAVVSFGVHAVLLTQLHWFLEWAELAAFVMLASVGLATVNHARSRFETQRVFQHLESHVPAPVAQQLALEDRNDKLSARRQELTVLFADIRNFSAFSEHCDPEEVARVLHEFYTTATGVIEEHDGVVEHMVGDSILAVWNGPRPCVEHAQQAVHAAQVMWKRCTEKLPDISGNDLQPLDIGIGLETGVATVGLFGPQNRRAHTVFGESVTVAVQLQALTADLASPVLAGESLATRVVGDWKPLGHFLLPGLRRSRRVFSLTVLTPNQQQQRLKLLDVPRSAAA